MKIITPQDFDELWNKDTRLTDANSQYLKLMGKNHPYFSRITQILRKIKDDPDEETLQNLYLDFVQYRKKIINDSKTLEL